MTGINCLTVGSPAVWPRAWVTGHFKTLFVEGNKMVIVKL